MAAGFGQVGHGGVEVLATAGAVMLGVEHDNVAGPAGEGVAEVMEGAAGGPVAVGAVTTSRTEPVPVIAAPNADVGPGKVLDAGDAFGGVGSVLAGSGHGDAPEGRVLSGDTPYSGRLFTDPARFPCYRLESPGVYGIIEVATLPHYSRLRWLSSDCHYLREGPKTQSQEGERTQPQTSP